MGDEDDANAFARMVGKVRRLRHDTAALERPRPAPVPRRVERDAAPPALHAGVASDHATSDETDSEGSYQRAGVQRGVLRKLRRGQFAVGDVLDLHGLTVREAGVRLAAFIEHARGRRLGCVRVIHGKGLSSPGLKAVLKPQVLHWLRQHQAVLAYTAARDRDGGSGAVYVLLRSRGD